MIKESFILSLLVFGLLVIIAGVGCTPSGPPTDFEEPTESPPEISETPTEPLPEAGTDEPLP
ncbi:hypothetical protein ACFL0Z_01705 [Patescibacteria group bacterium]